MSKPQNIIEEEKRLLKKIKEVEKQLPLFLTEYFIYLKNSCSVRTRLNYVRDIRLFLEYMFKDTKSLTIEQINSITDSEINCYLGEMETQKSTISRRKSSIKNFFDVLYRKKIINNNITGGIDPIHTEKKTNIVRLEKEQIKKMLNILKTGQELSPKQYIAWETTKYRDLAIMTIFLTQGLRMDELIQLNISSLNFDTNEMIIFRKRGKEISMPMTKDTAETIKLYIENERKNSGDALFISTTTGNRMHKNTIANLVKKYTSYVNTDGSGYSPHKLRATTASMLIESGVDIYSVQNYLDHDNVTTTQLYADHKKENKRRVANSVSMW